MQSNRRKGCRQEDCTHRPHPSCPPFSPQLDVKGCRDVYASFERYCDVELMDGPNQYKAEGHGLQVWVCVCGDVQRSFHGRPQPVHMWRGAACWCVGGRCGEAAWVTSAMKLLRAT